MAFKGSGATIVILLALSSAASADTVDDSGGRYGMSPVEGGFLRLDKQTGAVAMCAKSGSEWACKPVEDRGAPPRSDELTKLENENRALKDRVKALEDNVEAGKATIPDNGPPGGKVKLPTDEEVDQALDYMERLYKKIRDRVKNLDQPLPSTPQHDGAAPKGTL